MKCMERRPTNNALFMSTWKARIYGSDRIGLASEAALHIYP